jgi:O-antigen/teichoic acid export membrane protein
MALAMVFLSALDMLTDMGIGMDVVQHRRGDDPIFLNTAFLLAAGRGMAVALVAAGLAYPFAAFYRQPEIIALAIVGASSIAIRGMASSSVWTMTRHLQLRRLTLLTMSGEVIGFVVSIGWAILSPTAWALVAGRVATAVAFMIGSHLLSERGVSLLWDKGAARDIMAFGTGIVLSSATYFLGAEAERLIIGKFISLTELGCFSLALTMAAAPSRALQQVVGQVFFPAISQSVREDRSVAGRHYRSAKFVFLILSIVIGVGFIAYGKRLVHLLLPPKYAMAGWMLQLLGFRAGQEVFAAPTSSLILAHGDSRYAASANTLRLVLMVTGVWWAFSRFGLHQAVSVLAVVPAVTYFVLIPGVARHLRSAVRVEIMALLVFSAAMILAVILPWPWA